MNGRSSRARKRAATRKGHQREQRRRKLEALQASEQEAQFLAKNGEQLKRPRKPGTKAYNQALDEAMRKRGYMLVTRIRYKSVKKTVTPGEDSKPVIVNTRKADPYTTWEKRFHDTTLAK